MSPQTETRTGTGFKAGVKDYRLTYCATWHKVKPYVIHTNMYKTLLRFRFKGLFQVLFLHLLRYI